MIDIKNCELLRVPEFAAALNVEESTVRAWLLRRFVAKVKLGKRSIRIPASEVERLIAEGTIPARGRREAG